MAFATFPGFIRWWDSKENEGVYVGYVFGGGDKGGGERIAPRQRLITVLTTMSTQRSNAKPLFSESGREH